MTALLVMLILQATPLDRAEEHVESERFEQATRELEQADRADERFAAVRDGAVKGMARDLQRGQGYAAALDYLEERLESKSILEQFTETCIWSGEIDRGLHAIARLTGPLAEVARLSELHLHWERHDFATMESRATSWGWSEWADYARRQRELRDRFADRAARGWWVAAIAAVTMAAACLALARLAPAR